jgi:excisionase family DNA binding protein
MTSLPGKAPGAAPLAAIHPLFTPQTLADYLEVGVRTVYEWAKLGKLPRPMRLANNCLRWRREAIEQFLQKQEGAAHAS